MQRLRDLSRFWNWLPAFRAIGETSHLPSAARALNLSPSALSRSLTQLERSLGRPLFRRANRRLELTQEGEHFLAALRDAMRCVHEASESIQGAQLHGTLRVASSGVATSAWVLPAVLDLHRRYPGVTAELVTDLGDLATRLLSGRLDVAFGSDAVRHPRLHTEKLGVARAGVYCGPVHPLYHVTEVHLEDLQSHDFVAPPAAEADEPLDGWPADRPRRVVLHVDRMRLGCEACRRMPLLAVLPDLVAEALGGGELRRLPLRVIPDAPVYVTLRPPLAQVTSAEVLRDLVRESMAGAAP